jgi:hypothetical protein
MGLFSRDEVVERPFDVLNSTTEAKIDRMDTLLREINDIWAAMPRNYRLWIDWDSRPRRLTLVDSVHIERNIIAPR